MDRYYVLGFLFLLSALSACKPSSNQPEKIIRDTIIQEVPVEKIVLDTIYKKAENANWIRQTGGLVLFRHCRNTLSFQTDEGLSHSKFIYNNSKAQVILSKTSPNKVAIIPNGKTFLLSLVKKNDHVFGDTIDFEYSILTPPKPTIEFSINGKMTNSLTAPIPKNSRIEVKLKPDAVFKDLYPEDARYYISSIDVYAQLSLGAPTKVNSIHSFGRDATKGITVALGTRVRQSPPGTAIFIRINEIARKNYQNRVAPVLFSGNELIYTLVLK